MESAGADIMFIASCAVSASNIQKLCICEASFKLGDQRIFSMNTKTPKPDKNFLKTAKALAVILDAEQESKHSEELKHWRTLLQKEFEKAFGLIPDKRKLAQKFYYRFINTDLSPKKKLFDHLHYFQHGDNLVIVSQPYDVEETELKRWTTECGASYTIANEWGYYYPGKASLFLIEFTPQAKADVDSRIRKL
jgi:hypothetical protein